MAKDPGFQRYKNAILNCLSRSDISDLEVKCSDGNIKVPGLVLASVCSFFRRVEPRSLEDCHLILPDLTRDKVALFVRVLCGRDLGNVSQPDIRIIQDVVDVLRCSVDLSHCVYSPADLLPDPPPGIPSETGGVVEVG